MLGDSIREWSCHRQRYSDLGINVISHAFKKVFSLQCQFSVIAASFSRTSCISSQTMPLALGFRSRYAGW